MKGFSGTHRVYPVEVAGHRRRRALITFKCRLLLWRR